MHRGMQHEVMVGRRRSGMRDEGDELGGREKAGQTAAVYFLDGCRSCLSLPQPPLSLSAVEQVTMLTSRGVHRLPRAAAAAKTAVRNAALFSSAAAATRVAAAAGQTSSAARPARAQATQPG